MNDIAQQLQAHVRAASQTATPLRIVGGDSKAFYGRGVDAEALPVGRHRGIVHYEPTELVITARAGTPLAEIEQTLAEQGQMLAFEPPSFGEGATLGGTIACGLSGPRRPYAGAARDFVLGTTLLTGDGEILRFGGEVMKNVAGYDLSRLMCGALGTLGVLLEISLKVLPRPAQEQTLQFECTAEQAIEQLNRWAAEPLPLSGACHDGDNAYVRLSGAQAAVQAACKRLGGERLADGDTFWADLREHRLAFFDSDNALWRVSVPSIAAPLELPGVWMLDWGGAQRWLKSPANEASIREAAQAAGGHATLFRGGERDGEVFQRLQPAVAKLHQALKLRFDPQGVLNPGRMYAQW